MTFITLFFGMGGLPQSVNDTLHIITYDTITIIDTIKILEVASKFNWIGVLALFISFVSVSLAFVVAYQNRDHNKKTLRPSLATGKCPDLDKSEIAIILQNDGFGTAIVTKFNIFYKKELITDLQGRWRDNFSKLLETNLITKNKEFLTIRALTFTKELLIKGGGKKEILAIYPTKRDSMDDKYIVDLLIKINDFLIDNISFKIEYKSVYGELFVCD